MKTASQTLNKREVCEYLGKSKRSIETYVRDGRLPVGYVKGKNGNTAVFEREAVERFRRELDEGWREQPQFRKPRLVTDDVPAAPGAPPPRLWNGTGEFAPLAHLAKAVMALPALPAPVPTLARYVPLAQAAEQSGMPQAWLVAQARAGVPWAVNVSLSPKREVWRFRLDK